ncbi:hypothetical protein [Jeotgalibacillus sp. S-D1]|uniref:hypothetical protein n=1 Tax=Jeotgalibacillus sp. S-D1 TaxID=2552189 RepID=UPI001404A698|nr:hypothetical protein [Jeotgalibacillus sp. S-D1]
MQRELRFGFAVHERSFYVSVQLKPSVHSCTSSIPAIEPLISRPSQWQTKFLSSH